MRSAVEKLLAWLVLGGNAMPKFRYLFLAVTSLTLGGCGYFFPSFEGFFGLHSYIHDIPVNRITTELQCELGRFLQEETGNQNILDPSAPAGVAIKFQTDQSGTFQYVGIDLSKFGLAGVANLDSAIKQGPEPTSKSSSKNHSVLSIGPGNRANLPRLSNPKTEVYRQTTNGARPSARPLRPIS